MPNQFKDLADFLDPFLGLPIRGKTYEVPSPSVAVGLRAQATVAIAAKVRAGADVSPEDLASLQLDDAEEVEFTQSMLGPVFDEMVADKLPWEYVRHAAKTAFMWCISDRDQAAEVWASLGNVVSRPTPQDRRPAKKAAAISSGGKTKTASSRSSSKRTASPRTRASAGGAS